MNAMPKDCYRDLIDEPTRVMLRPPKLMRLPTGHLASTETNLIKLPADFLARVESVAPRKRLPKAVILVAALAFGLGVSAVSAQPVLQFVNSHVLLAR